MSRSGGEGVGEVADFGGELFGRFPGVFEALPGYGLTENYLEVVAACLAYFRRKKNLLDIEFYAELFSPQGRFVKSIAVTSPEIYRHNVALRLYGLCHERFLPIKIFYLTVFPKPGAKTRGELEYLFFRVYGIIYDNRCFPALFAKFIYREKHVFQRLHIHQHIVDEKADIIIAISLPQNTNQGDAVKTSERMVGCKHESSVGG